MRAAGDSPSGGRGTIQMPGPTVQAWDLGLLLIVRNFFIIVIQVVIVIIMQQQNHKIRRKSNKRNHCNGNHNCFYGCVHLHFRPLLLDSECPRCHKENFV